MEFGLGGWIAVFGVAAAVVVVAGTVLARAGDEIATRTGLGGLLVGMLLLSVATSLPELATDISAAVAGAPDLAVGDLMGSSMANMAILAVIDLAHRDRVWHRVGLGHARLAAIAIALTAIAVLAILRPPGIAIGWVGVDTVVIVVGYIAAAAWMKRSRTGGRARGGQARDGTGEIIAPTGWSRALDGHRSLRTEVIRFAIAAGVILVAAPFLAISGEGIAEESGASQSFVGALLLAGATSLPELVASLAAVRIGAYDMAVGNLFGSNAFNMTILFAADLAYTPGPILAAVSPTQAISGIGAILLMALALAAVVHGDRTRLRHLEPDAIAVLLTYGALLGLVWSAGS
jgi:cation:H+ antiporter